MQKIEFRIHETGDFVIYDFRFAIVIDYFLRLPHEIGKTVISRGESAVEFFFKLSARRALVC